MPVINTYLTFPGNCEEAFNFYKSIFGGEFPYIGRFKDMPAEQCGPIPDNAKEKIMHMSLPIGNSVLMGSDAIEGFGPPHIAGNNFSLSVNTGSDAEADKLFSALSTGGQTIMPLGKTFWGSYFGMLTDKFGIQWMVSHEQEKNK